MNLSTLAKLCGVSAATVSKAFSGSGEISEETKNKIFEIAKKHGVYDRYNKNKYDRKVIAVMCPELNSDFYNKFVTLLDKEITEAGGIMTVSVTNFDEERERTILSYYNSYCKVDGIITINQSVDVDKSITVPVVAISPGSNAETIDIIKNINCLDDVIRYLKDNGHTEIGFVGEPLTIRKSDTFKEAMRNNMLLVKDEYIRISSLRFEEAGIQVMDRWFDEGKELPTAIIAAYDYVAIGIIKSIQSHGLKVPNDISVIGMDDIAVGTYLETPLSTIKANTELICQKATEIIMNKIKNFYYHESFSVPYEFVPRGTSGKVKK